MTDDQIIEKLPGDLRRIAEVIGLNSTLKLAREFRGLWLYMHSLDHIEREVRNTEIKSDFDRLTSVKDMTATAAVERLAVKHKLTSRQIWHILGTEPDDPAPAPLLDFFKN